MTLNEYQEKAMSTCMDTCGNPLYMLFGLQSEVGELMGKYAKLIRKGLIRFDNNQVEFTDKIHELSESELNQISHDIESEFGDCLWLLTGAITIYGSTLQEIGRGNLAKLADRKNRNVIDGNGDNR